MKWFNFPHSITNFKKWPQYALHCCTLGLTNAWMFIGPWTSLCLQPQLIPCMFQVLIVLRFGTFHCPLAVQQYQVIDSRFSVFSIQVLDLLLLQFYYLPVVQCFQYLWIIQIFLKWITILTCSANMYVIKQFYLCLDLNFLLFWLRLRNGLIVSSRHWNYS